MFLDPCGSAFVGDSNSAFSSAALCVHLAGIEPGEPWSKQGSQQDAAPDPSVAETPASHPACCQRGLSPAT